MTTNHKPTSPLPWLAGQTVTAARPDRPHGSHERVAVAQRVNRGQDAAYLIHAANAYPELIEALRLIRLNRDGQIVHRASLERVDALLAKLGEL